MVMHLTAGYLNESFYQEQMMLEVRGRMIFGVVLSGNADSGDVKS